LLASRTGWRAGLTAFAFVLAGLILGARTPDLSIATLATSAALGAVSYWLYSRFVLFRLDLVPPLVLCLTLLGTLQALLRPAYPGAAPAALVGMASLAAGYALWQWLVRMDRLP
jgi:xanthine/uracil permease